MRALVLLLMALRNLGVQLLPLVAGLSIILTQPFRVGQDIQVAGVDGQVEHVSLFSTLQLLVDR